jgi:NAD(P)-dependent dehydrogenase (short-subunit alcohol dehydrogenase family)
MAGQGRDSSEKDRQERILDAAVRLLGQDGISAVSMRAVARQRRGCGDREDRRGHHARGVEPLLRRERHRDVPDVQARPAPCCGRRRDVGTASVVNFGSYDGFVADPGLAAYCAAKGAVHALTGPWRATTARTGSGFNGPGSGAGGRSIAQLQAVRDLHPLRRYGIPDDVANLVAWVASDEACYASGQLWVLDGGLTAQVQQMRVPPG